MEREIPYQRAFVKYTPTWPRSFMPQNQTIRDLVTAIGLPKERLCTHCWDGSSYF